MEELIARLENGLKGCSNDILMMRTLSPMAWLQTRMVSMLKLQQDKDLYIIRKISCHLNFQNLLSYGTVPKFASVYCT